MKIMQFIHGLPTGGAETLVKDYVLNFNREKNEVILLCLHHDCTSPYENILKKSGVRMIFVEDFLKKKNLNFFIKVANFFHRYLIVKKIINRENPDVLHIHMPLYTYVKFAKPKRKTLIVTTIHGELRKVWRINGKPRRLEYAATKWLIKKYNMRFIVLHDQMKKEIDRMFGISDSVILNNGIDVSKYKKIEDRDILRARLGVPKGSFTIGHIGRFVYQKNHEFLVDMFKEVKNMNENAFLLMVGDGEKRVAIEKRLNEYGLDNDYLVLSNRDDVPDLLSVMDVFVFPSRYEGLGIALIEAQEAKLPCFVSDAVPEYATISNLVTRLPLDVGPKKWAEEILNYKKPNEVILNDEDWDIKEVTKQLENIYEEALREKRNGKK